MNFELNPLSTLRMDLSPSGTSGNKLFVIFHGILNSHRQLEPLVNRIRSEAGERAEIWIPKLPWAGVSGTMFGFGDLDTVISNMRADLDRIWSCGRYESITFIGHSMGGITVRALYLEGIKKAEASDSKGPNAYRHWATPSPQDRMVLLAAVNRGAGATRLMSMWKAAATQVATGLFTAIEGFFPHLANTVRRDSHFISKLRLEWVANKSKLEKLTVVQLLGSQDDVVGPDDTLDLVTGENFYYLDVPQTGHIDILNVGLDGESQDTPKEQLRWDAIRSALFEDQESIEKNEIRPWGLARQSESDKAMKTNITDVVFVIHGIRDPGHWTDKIARKIWKAGSAKSVKFERVVESYGYFGMGPFLFPGYRREKVNWLIERYIEARAKYPNAKFHFVGHSHGTYAFAKMLEIFPDCRFDNVVFVGSVVRPGFEWAKLREEGRVRRLLNFVATGDLVVAIFPSVFDTWNIQDLGGAGHLGFSDTDPEKEIYSINYAVGGHSAARQEDMWDAIAGFIVNTPPNGLPDPLAQIQDQSAEVEGRLEFKRRGFWALAALTLNPLGLLLCAVILVAALGGVPWVLITYTAPWFANLILHLPSGLGWPVLIIGFLGSGLLFALTQRKYKRAFGTLRSFVGAGVLTYASYLIWQTVPNAEAFSGPGLNMREVSLTAIVSTLHVVLWLLFLRFVLRRV